jgi:hypothetical protein
MKPSQWDLTTESVQANFNAYVTNQRLIGKRPIFQEVKKARSLNQNAMAFALYKQIAVQAEDKSINDVRCQCKLDYGVPIRCANDLEFAEVWGAIEAATTYEQRLFLMLDQEVTRNFGKAEFTDYIDEIIREFSKQGYALAHPSEERMESLRAAE